jgi:hypothetical protein
MTGTDREIETTQQKFYDDMENPGLHTLLEARDSKVGREYLREERSVETRTGKTGQDSGEVD